MPNVVAERVDQGDLADRVVATMRLNDPASPEPLFVLPNEIGSISQLAGAKLESALPCRVGRPRRISATAQRL